MEIIFDLKILLGNKFCNLKLNLWLFTKFYLVFRLHEKKAANNVGK